MTNKTDVNEGSAALLCYLDDTPVDLRWLDGKFERIAHPHGPEWTVWNIGTDTFGRYCVVKQQRQEHATFNAFYCGTDLSKDIWKVQMVNDNNFYTDGVRAST